MEKIRKVSQQKRVSKTELNYSDRRGSWGKGGASL